MGYNLSMKTHLSSLIQKAFSLSISNIWRNKLLSLATIFVIGTILFIFNIILAANFTSQDALSDLSQKIDITVYLNESTDFADTERIIEDVKQLEGVTNVRYTSKDDALKKIKQTHPDLPIAFEQFDLGNPLPASIDITTKHPSYHEQVAEFLGQNQYSLYLSNIVTSGGENSTILTSVAKNLSSLTNFVNQLIFWIIVIFIIGGALIILNAIQITIFNRKKEINVMKLVGASHWFIRLPFIIESILYGLFGAILSFVMFTILAQNIEIKETSLFSYFSEIRFYNIFLIELLITIVLSIFSATIAVHEYLNKNLLDN